MSKYRQFIIVIWALAITSGVMGQECRAVTDCSTGRCIATTICSNNGNSVGSQPIAKPPATERLVFKPIPPELIVKLTYGIPDSSGRVKLNGQIAGVPKISDIRVNGNVLEVLPDNIGNISLFRVLKVGVNDFTLSVTDEYGRVSSAKVSIFQASATTDNRISEKRVALVIGNAAYKNNPLLNPVNDADDFSSAIVKMGFTVKNLRNSNIANMRRALREFGDDLMNSDAGLIYYAGHAVEVKGRNYLIPIGGEVAREDEVPDQSLDLGAVLEKIETSKKTAVVILDACRNNPFGRGFRSSATGLARVDSPSGTLVAFSTSPGRVAADGEGRNSPYTKHLLRAIQLPNMPIEHVLKVVRKEVSAETNGAQVPWENTSLMSDFVFLKR